MIIRELLVSLGVVADLDKLQKFDTTTEKAKASMAAAAAEADKMTKRVQALASGEKEAVTAEERMIKALLEETKARKALSDEEKEAARVAEQVSKRVAKAQEEQAAAMEKAKTKAKEMRAEVVSGLQSVATWSARASLAIAAALAGLGASLYSYASAGSEAEKGAQRTALSVESYQRIAFALSQADVASEQFEAGFKMLNSKMQTAVGNGDSYIETLSGMKISIKGANGELLTQEQMLYRVADLVQAATTDREKLTIAMAAFGEEVGARMVPALDQGGAALQQMGVRAEALGGVISTKAAKAGAHFMDQLGELKLAAEGLRNQLGEVLLPVLIDLADKLLVLAERFGPVVKRVLDTKAGMIALEVIIGTLTVALGALGLTAAAAGAAAAIASLLTPVGALAALIGGGLAIGLTMLIGHFVAFSLVLEDVYYYFTGGRSALGEFLDQWRDSPTFIGSAVRIFEALVGALRSAYDAFAPIRDLLGNIFDSLTGGGLSGFSSLVDILNAIGRAAEGIIPAIEALSSLITGAASGIDAIASYGGGFLGVGGGSDAASAAAGAAAGQSIRNVSSQVQQTVSITLNGGDQSMIEQIRQVLEDANRQAAATFAGAEV